MPEPVSEGLKPVVRAEARPDFSGVRNIQVKLAEPNSADPSKPAIVGKEIKLTPDERGEISSFLSTAEDVQKKVADANPQYKKFQDLRSEIAARDPATGGEFVGAIIAAPDIDTPVEEIVDGNVVIKVPAEVFKLWIVGNEIDVLKKDIAEYQEGDAVKNPKPGESTAMHLGNIIEFTEAELPEKVDDAKKGVDGKEDSGSDEGVDVGKIESIEDIANGVAKKKEGRDGMTAEQVKALEEKSQQEKQKVLEGVRAYNEITADGVQVRGDSNVDDIIRQLHERGHMWEQGNPETRAYIQAAIERATVDRARWAYEELDAMGVDMDDVSDTPESLLKKVQEKDPTWQDDKATKEYLEEALWMKKDIREGDVPPPPPGPKKPGEPPVVPGEQEPPKGPPKEPPVVPGEQEPPKGPPKEPPVVPEGQKPGELQLNYNVVVAGDRDQILHKEASRKETNATYLLEQRQALTTDKKLTRATKNLVAGFWQRGLWGSVFREREGRWLRATVAKTGLVELPQELLEKALKEGKTAIEKDKNGKAKRKLGNALSNITGARDTADRYAARDWLVGQVAKAKAELGNADPNFKDASVSDEVRKAYRGGTKDKDAMASRLAINDVVDGNGKVVDTAVKAGERRDAIQDKNLQKELTKDFFTVLLPFIKDPNMSSDQARELINQYCSPEGYKPAGATDALKLRDRIAGSEKDYKKLFESQFTAVGANMVQVAEVLKAQKDQLQAKGIVTNPDDPASWIAATESQDPEKHLNFNFYVAKGEMSEGGADIRKLDRFMEGKHLMADHKVGSTLNWLASWGNAHGSSEISAAAAGGYLGSLVASLAPTDWGKVRRYSALAGVPLVVAGSGGTLLIPLAVSAGAAGMASGLKEMNSLMKRKRAVEKRSSFGIDTSDPIPQAFMQKAMKKIYGHTTNAELQKRIVTQVEASKMLDGMRNSGLFSNPDDLTSAMPATLTKENVGQALRWLGETKARLDLTATRGNRYIKYNEQIGEAVQDQKLAGVAHEVTERLMNAFNNDPALNDQFITSQGFANFGELYARVHDTYEASILGGSLKKKERLGSKASKKDQEKVFKVLKDAGVSEADMGRLKKEETTKAKNRATKKLYARKFAHRFTASAATSLVAGGIVAEGRHHVWPQDTPTTLVDHNVSEAFRHIKNGDVTDAIGHGAKRVGEGLRDLGRATFVERDLSGAGDALSEAGAHIKDTTSDTLEGIGNVGIREPINHGRDAIADAYHAVRDNDWSGAGDLVERTVDKLHSPIALEGDHAIGHSSSETIVGANQIHVRFPDGSKVNGNDLTLPDGQHFDLTKAMDASGNINPNKLTSELSNMGVISEGVIPGSTGGTHTQEFKIGQQQGVDLGSLKITLPNNVDIIDSHDVKGNAGGDWLPDTIRITQPNGSFRDIDLGKGLLLSDQKDVDHLIRTLNSEGITTVNADPNLGLGQPRMDTIVNTPATPGTAPRAETLNQFYNTHTQHVDHVEAYAYNTPDSEKDELMLYGEKHGDALRLDMSHMQVGYQNGLNPESIDVQQVIRDGNAVFAFRNPDNPSEMMLIKAPGGKLDLSPTSNAPLTYMKDGKWQIAPTSEIAGKLVNENVLQQRPDGPYPIEYENIRGTLNVGGSDGTMGDVMAGTVQERDGQVVFQSFARIQDNAHNNPAVVPGTPGTGPVRVEVPRYDFVGTGPVGYDIYDYGMSSDLSAGVVGLSYADQGESMKRGKPAGTPDNVTPLPPIGRTREEEATINNPTPDDDTDKKKKKVKKDKEEDENKEKKRRNRIVIPFKRKGKDSKEEGGKEEEVKEAGGEEKLVVEPRRAPLPFGELDTQRSPAEIVRSRSELELERDRLLGLGVRDAAQQIRLDELELLIKREDAKLKKIEEVRERNMKRGDVAEKREQQQIEGGNMMEKTQNKLNQLRRELENLTKLPTRTDGQERRIESLREQITPLEQENRLGTYLLLREADMYRLRLKDDPLTPTEMNGIITMQEGLEQLEEQLKALGPDVYDRVRLAVDLLNQGMYSPLKLRRGLRANELDQLEAIQERIEERKARLANPGTVRMPKAA